MRRYFVLSAAMLAVAVGRTSFAQPERVIERTVRAATLVVLAEPVRFKRPSPRAEFRIAKALKGKLDSRELLVSLEKAPVGLWPKRGQRMILCLSAPASGRTYELTSHFGSVLSPDNAEMVGRMIARMEPGVAVAGADGAVPASELDVKVTEAMTRHVDEAETILVGVLSDVRLVGADGAVGAFKVEEALLGYADYPAPVTVLFPGDPPPKAGRYVLYLRGSRRGSGFTVTSRPNGVVRLTDPVEEANLRRPIAKAVGPRAHKFTTIQATMAEWQVAWNKRDLDLLMRCYSRHNSLRKRYELGEEARKGLKEQLAGFPGTVELSLQEASRARPTTEGAKDAADVRVLLKLVAKEAEDRRPATMRFVLEGGEWLILEEGF